LRIREDYFGRGETLVSNGETARNLFGPELSSQFEHLATLSTSMDEIDLDALEETIRAAIRLPLDDHTKERFESLLEAWLPEDSDIDPLAVMAVLDKNLIDSALSGFAFEEPFARKLRRISRVFWPQLKTLYEVIHLGPRDWHRVTWLSIGDRLGLTIERRDLTVLDLEFDPDSFVGFISRVLGILAHLPPSLVQAIDIEDWHVLHDMWEHAQEEVEKTQGTTTNATEKMLETGEQG
jgi:hypothetical protein